MQSKHTMSYIPLKKFGNWSSSLQNFIKYKSNYSEEMKPINLKLTERKTDPHNDENANDFK